MYRFGFTLQKKTGLLCWAKTIAKAQKTAAKGPFGLLRRVLLRWFHLPAMHCRNSSIAAVTKNATINSPFSGVLGFLWGGRKPPPYAVRIHVY